MQKQIEGMNLQYQYQCACGSFQIRCTSISMDSFSQLLFTMSEHIMYSPEHSLSMQHRMCENIRPSEYIKDSKFSTADKIIKIKRYHDTIIFYGFSCTAPNHH